ncbi:MAG TPA: hypothetical protein DCR40_01235 [Prolixibacteraceae bacterium]|nr:hypothetical protein [Prolixibacteraceae bacterium]
MYGANTLGGNVPQLALGREITCEVAAWFCRSNIHFPVGRATKPGLGLVAVIGRYLVFLK